MNMPEHLSTEGDSQKTISKLENSSITIPVIKEDIEINKEVVETAKISVTKKIISEEFNAEVPLFKETIKIEKKALNQFIDGDVPQTRVAGNTTIIPILKEVYVKRIILVEEIHITKDTSTLIVSVNDTLRREKVNVANIDNNQK